MFFDRVSLCSPSWPGTCYVNKVGSNSEFSCLCLTRTQIKELKKKTFLLYRMDHLGSRELVKMRDSGHAHANITKYT